MSIEGPYLAAIIARLPDPKVNLAAYGVAFALGLLFESPVIMMMSASTALVAHRRALEKLSRFTWALNGGVTVAMALFLVPRVFTPVAEHWIGLSPQVADLTRRACLLMLPWPAAIGYRRFYQGIMIRAGLTRRVAYGTAIRLVAMTSAALLLAFRYGVDGALVGAASLSAGVTVEAVVSRFMAAGTVHRLRRGEYVGVRAAVDPSLSYGRIWVFYYPLALTALIHLGVNPAVTFFLGRSRMALESLAVVPVVLPFVFLFSNLGFALQEVAISLLGPAGENRAALKRFATLLAAGSTCALVVVAATPLLPLWLDHVAGLQPDLSALATVGVRIMFAMPALSVALSFQRARLIAARRTQAVSWATAIEVLGIVTVLFTGVRLLDAIGAYAAATAILAGRAGEVSFLYVVQRSLAAAPRVDVRSGA